MKIIIMVLLAIFITIWLAPNESPEKHIDKTAEAKVVIASDKKKVKDEESKPAVKNRTVKKKVAKPNPEPTQAEPTVQVGDCNNYEELFQQYDWDINIALAVCQAESGGDPNAYSSTHDRGLMQVNPVHRAKVGGNLNKLYDPVTNIEVAWQIYSDAGWSAWSAFNNGSYLRFL